MKLINYIVVVLIIVFVAIVFINLLPIILGIIFLSILFNSLNRNTRYGKTRSGNRTRFYYTNSDDFFRDFNQHFNQDNFNQNYQQNNYNQNFNERYNFNSKKDEYMKILGVDSTMTKEEIKKAYFKKVKQYHPDKFINASDDVKKMNEEKLKKINEAYDNLMKYN